MSSSAKGSYYIWTSRSGRKYMRRSPIKVYLVNKKCSLCDKIFVPRHSYNKFCSKSCGKKKGNYVLCLSCKKSIWKKPYDIKNKKCFCSRNCANSFHSKFMRIKLKNGSGNPYYRSGRRYEYKVIQELYADGFMFVTRSVGSKGIFDVWGIKLSSHEIVLKLIQVKGMRNVKTFNSAISKKERAILFNSILNDNFKFGFNFQKKIIGIPVWVNIVHFELWLYEKNKGCHKFRLQYNGKSFDIMKINMIDDVKVEEKNES